VVVVGRVRILIVVGGILVGVRRARFCRVRNMVDQSILDVWGGILDSILPLVQLPVLPVVAIVELPAEARLIVVGRPASHLCRSIRQGRVVDFEQLYIRSSPNALRILVKGKLSVSPGSIALIRIGLLCHDVPVEYKKIVLDDGLEAQVTVCLSVHLLALTL